MDQRFFTGGEGPFTIGHSTVMSRKSFDISSNKIYLKSISEHIKADPTLGRTNEPIRHIMDYEKLSKIAAVDRSYTMTSFNV